MTLPAEDGANSAEAGRAAPLTLERPGSQGRATSMLVKTAPFLGDAKARSLEKTGDLSGLAPPSAILDGTMPLVDLEVDRLQDAMSWLYTTVKALQQKGSAVDSRLTGLQGALEQLQQDTPVDMPVVQGAFLTSGLDPPGAATAEAEAHASREAPSTPASPTSGVLSSPQLAALRRMIQQLEKKQSAGAKLLEMRLDTLQHELDLRLQPQDLQQVKVDVSQKLDGVQTKAREDMGILGSLIQGEAAGDRRRLQAQLEVISNRVTAQLQLTEKMLNENWEKQSQEVKAINDRLQAMEGSSSHGIEERLQALEKKGKTPGDRLAESRRLSQLAAVSSASSPGGRETTPEQQRISRRPSINDERRITNLEQALEHLETKVEERLRTISSSSSVRPTYEMPPPDKRKSSEGSTETYSLLADFSHRLGIMEAKLEESSKKDVHHQLIELHRQQTQAHHQMLEISSKFSQIEEAAKQREQMDSMQMEMQSRLLKLESGGREATQQLEEAQKGYDKELKSQAHTIERTDKSLAALIKYVTGEEMVPDDSVESRPSSQQADKGEWKLAWLERRIEGLVKKKGGVNLESRLRKLEQGNKLPPDLGERTKKLETDFASLDIKDLTQVRPDLNDHRKYQEEVSNHLIQELKELKCLVGCVEACIPRETRKAVALFKRAAGANEGEPTSPRDFQVESKILKLREEMTSKIEGAANRLEDGREHMTQIVRSIERKQDMLDAKLTDVKAIMSHPASRQGILDFHSDVLALPPLQELQIADSPADVVAAVAPAPAAESQGARGGAQTESVPVAAKATSAASATPAADRVPSGLARPPPGWS